MIEGDMLQIRVPGSTANLGPGFDSLGLALSLYLTLDVEISDSWEVVMQSEELRAFPTDETNFIIKVAIETADKYNKSLSPCKITMKSDIPLARGLGSSAAAIIAGIELANVVGNLNLTNEEKFKVASEIEGHPDNVGASLYGGLVIGSQMDGEVEAIVYHNLDFDVVAVVPHQELLTKESREVLPKQYSSDEAVKASAVSNVFVAALLSKNYPLAGKVMKKDLFHQPYRKHFVPQLPFLEKFAEEHGAFGVALSGAGPTVICCVENNYEENLLEALTQQLPEMNIFRLRIDQVGSTVKVHSELTK
ncbi:homoserine kinase [Cytobacillus sp. FJAT-54145]|uniref:Homoserine kinase n=1 Tax=Cytobacillus spartinae TaxID=3299023 RepID=A0ABW6KDL3_9BACI